MSNDANREEALRCLELSKEAFSSGNYDMALNLVRKSIRMFPCQENEAWLGTVQESEKSPNQSTKRGEKVLNDQVDSNHFTQDQHNEVKAFMKLDRNDYYLLLGVDKSANDADIKKAYRKMALKFHPDKNQAPSADEAFKLVSLAFSTLSDPEKRSNYDRFGATSGGTGFSPFSNHQSYSTQGQVSPEELFNMFFSGFHNHQGPENIFFQSFFDMNTNQNPFFAFTTGSNQFNSARQRRNPFHNRQNPHQNTSRSTESHQNFAKIIQFIPVLVILLLSFLNSWLFPEPDITRPFSSFSEINHLVSFTKSSSYPHPRATLNHKVPYYSSPSYQAHFKNSNQSKKLQAELNNYESLIEGTFIKNLRVSCKAERDVLLKRLSKASPEEEEKLRSEALQSCSKLTLMGLKEQ